ncbi:MAG: hypothetical protein HQL64_13665 [Magnetococcales bacterium]|nr:hypothetical protein [Magnetococcales bacterium]
MCRSLVCRLSFWMALFLVAWGGWFLLGRAVSLPDVPQARFQCLSYTPFRGDQTPFDPTLVIPPEQIREDLALLAPHTDCVRTYSTRMGLEAVVPLARQYGLQLLPGIWIGREAKSNRLEIHSTLSATALHPQSVRAIIVGNEVLLRKEQDAQGLIQIIEEVRRQTTLPLTYADVWEFWLKNPEVAAHVDFLTIHILPYWEDVPVSVTDALQHVAGIVAQVQAAFPGKPILIGETGWPSAGRSRERAVPGLVNQARFVREFIALTRQAGVPYNLIEAFDQPWKRFQEGTVGGHWGLFDTGRHPKFSLAGPVSEHPLWPWLLGAGGLLSALAMGMARRRTLAWWRWLVLAACGHGVVGIFYLHTRQLAGAAITPSDWLWGVAGSGMSALSLVLLGVVSIAPECRWGRVVPPDLATVRAWLLRRLPPGESPALPELTWGALRAVTLVAAALLALPLVVDGRYRDFPAALFLAPALLFLHRLPAGRQPMEAWLGALLALCLLLGVVVETPVNREAMAWNVVILLLIIPLRRVMAQEWRYVSGREEGAMATEGESSPTRASMPPTNPTAPPRAL